ncbi:TetR/AcrR family transcriptional regulator [Gordonia sp. CPCC 205333]|uniref:TetR/AcrR family transcriptional regulator n=1 Tax=Gordonia sp. CPCC 205333 TaxID=3140790 RepID=UPI003AF3ACB4
MTAEPITRGRQRAEHLGPQRRRPQILDAALRIAVTEGVAAVTIASVAERIDVTRPVVYGCFTSRVDLIAELVRNEEANLWSSLTDVLHAREVDADESVFIEGFRALLHTVDARPDGWRLLYGNPDPAVAAYFGRGRQAALERCTELLRPTLHAWGVDDPELKLPALVELWVSASEGAVRTLLADDRWTPDTLGAFVGTRVYRAMRVD